MAKKLLVIDSCVRREESRTKQMLDAALETFKDRHPDWETEILNLMELDLDYWRTDTLKARDALLEKKDYDDPIFRYAHQFHDADGIVVAAPFWDLSIPAVLKVYVENISVDGITFDCNAEGMYGLCRGKWMLFLTTRGGIWAGSDMEQGSTYMEALCRFFGVKEYHCIYADGIDIQELDGKAILEKAIRDTRSLCESLTL